MATGHSGIVEEVARGEADRLIEAHVSEAPHHEPPCPFFTEHRDTMRWTLGICSAVAVFVVGYLQISTGKAEALAERVAVEHRTDSQEVRVALAEMQRDFKYVMLTVDEIKADLKSRNAAK